MTRRPLPKPRLVNPAEFDRAVFLQALIGQASTELIGLVGASDDYWPEWEDQNEAIHNAAHELSSSGASLCGRWGQA